MKTSKVTLNNSIKLALPLMAAFLAQKFMQFIDTLMMGWLGADALAAGGIATAFFITVSVFCMGTLSAVGIFISRAKGSNDKEEIKSSFQQGVMVVLLLSLPCMLIIWFMPYVLPYLGQNQEVIKNVELFLHGLVWGFPGFLLFLILREFIAAFSFTKTVMIVALGSIPVTFGLNYLLMYGNGLLPALGIAGIGYSGAVVMWMMFLCLYLYSAKKEVLKEFVSFRSFKIDTAKIKDIFFIGAPSGLLFVLESGMFLSATIMIGYIGVNELAAYQIAIQCAIIAYALPIALSMVTALQVGQAVGSQNFSHVKQIIRINLVIALVFALFTASIFFFCPRILISLFINSKENDFIQLNAISITFLKIAAVFQIFDAIQTIANGALRGLKDTFVPMLLSAFCYWIVGVGGAYILAFNTSLKANGVWFGIILGILCTSILLIMRLREKLLNLDENVTRSNSHSYKQT